MRRFAAILLSCLPLLAWAEPPTEAQVERLLYAMQAHQQVEMARKMVVPMMRRGMEQSSKGYDMTPEKRARIQAMTDAFVEKTMPALLDEMSWAKTKPMMVQIYMETYDAAEVQGIIDFYESPAGQAFVAKAPIVMQKSMAMTQARMQDMTRRMQEAMKEAIEGK